MEPQHRNRFVAAIGLVIFVSGLFVIAFLGHYNRYWADDWCYNADFQRLGFWKTMMGYTHITTYASNRFSLTLFSGLIYLGGLFGVQAMTLLVVLFWAWGMFLLFRNVNELGRLRLSTPQLLLAAAVIVYYSINLAPHLYQSIYWRSGLLPYTAPVVFGVWVFALITVRAIHGGRVVMILAAVLSFIGGGFSEAGSATLTAMLLGYVMVCLLFRSSRWARDSMPAALASLLASILAMIVLILSPTITYRLGLYDGATSLIEFPGRLMYYTYEFFAYNVRATPLTHLVVFWTLILTGLLTLPSEKTWITARTWFWMVFLIALFTLVFVAASISPGVYIEQGLPALRTRIIPQFLFILGYGLVALVSGVFFRQYAHWRTFAWAVPVLLLSVYAFGANSVISLAGKAHLYADRAAAWDERDAQIQRSNEAGVLEVNVRGIDGLPVGGILDLKDGPGPGYWVNNCAARFYGVKAIHADLP